MKLVYGWGINDSPPSYTIVNGKKVKCPYYSDWSHVLERALSEKLKIRQPAYVDCTIDPRWQRLSDFKRWVDEQPNRDWRNCHIDKDILVDGNKHYGPDTCCYVGFELNMFLTDRAALRGQYPVGVYFEKDSGKFKSQICDPFTGKKVNLGRFLTPEEAHIAWKIRKSEYATTYAESVEDFRLKQALINRFKDDKIG
jgi:hypothetical protein